MQANPLPLPRRLPITDIELRKSFLKGTKIDLTTGIPDLKGKVAIVTGANSPRGIGWNTAHQLALNGAKVYVGARSEIKAREGIREMKEASPGKSLSLEPFVGDLKELKEVKAAVLKFIQNESRLDILVNNAATSAQPLDKAANGISLCMLTNHVGPFLLTTELLPIIRKTALQHPGVRIVTVSSIAHALPGAGVKFSSIEDFNVEFSGSNGFQNALSVYGLSKLANILFTKELQRLFEKENIAAIALSVHPGMVLTDGAIRFGSEQRNTLPQSLPSPEEIFSPLDGSLTSLFAATAPAVWEEKEKYQAQYLVPWGVVAPSSDYSNDAELASELWKTTEKVVRDILETKEDPLVGISAM